MLPRYQESHTKRVWAQNISVSICAECYKNDPVVPPLLAVIVIGKESGFRPNVRGQKGEVGLFQIMPAGVVAKGHNVEQLLNPFINIRLGVNSLRDGIVKCGSQPWQAAEFHHFGRCLKTPTYYGRWVQKKFNEFETE